MRLETSEESRVLVTGASGFIGLNCVEHLLAAGYSVIGVADVGLPEPAVSEFLGLSGTFDFTLMDIREGDLLAELMVGSHVGAVVHAAAITPGRARERAEPDLIRDVNIVGTRSVLGAAASARVDRLVYVSSGAVIGPASFGSQVIDEETQPRPDTLYGRTKLVGESLTEAMTNESETVGVIARLAAAFGPWERNTGVRDTLSPLYQLAVAARRGELLRVPDGDVERNWLYARDAAAALAWLAVGPRPGHGTYVVSPSEGLRVSAFGRYLARDVVVPDPTVEDVVRFDGDPTRARARVDNSRLRSHLPDWPAYPPTRAFDDYLRWLRIRPDWE